MKKNILYVPLFLIASFAFAEGWFMAQTEKANLSSVGASSELVEAQYNGKYLYPPINVLDGDFETTWCEAEKNGPGIGESITIEFSEAVSFDEIQIVNGFASKTHSDYYKKNNRIKTLQITQVAGKHFQQKDYELADGTPGYQPVKFELAQTAKTLTLKIVAVYKGEKYDDTCLSDIRLLYKGKVIPFGNVKEIKKVQEENARLLLKSDKNSFEKQFYELIGNGAYFRNADDDFIYVCKRNSNLEFNKCSIYEWLVKSDSKENLMTVLNQKYKNFNWDWDWRDTTRFKSAAKGISYNNKNPADFSYALIGTHHTWSDDWHELGSYKILTHETIGYVETVTATLIKLDGKSIYLNGVKYEVIPSEKVMFCGSTDDY